MGRESLSAELFLAATGAFVLPAEGASVQVNVRGGGAATVFQAETGAPTVANPLTVDAQGKVAGWVDEGSYDLSVSNAGRNLIVLNPARPFEAASGATVKAAPTLADLVSKAPNASYRMLLNSSGSHTAARVAGTYGMAQSQPLAISGTGTLYPLNTVLLDAADFPTVSTLVPKLRVRAQLYTNDVAPTGNYTVGLHPITRPATSGGAGLCIYTIGVAVAGSTLMFGTPAADAALGLTGSDFALPTTGHYVIGVVTTATVATSSHVHLTAQLQMRNA